MKTPLQELIESITLKDSKDHIVLIPTISKAEIEAMLKKEKEAMCEFAERYLDSIPKEHPSVEDVYNETFNTNQENLQDSTNGYTYYPQENKTVFNIKGK